jgi:hypothetical protein
MALRGRTTLRYKGFQIAVNDTGNVVEVLERDVPIAGTFGSFEAAVTWLDQVIQARQRGRPDPKPPNPPKPAEARFKSNWSVHVQHLVLRI